MVMTDSIADVPTHYEVLGLPQTFGANSGLSAQQLKAAYRRALFQYHPDKSQARVDLVYPRIDSANAKMKPAYTVDQISVAYGILSVPKLRAEYDQDLKLRTPSADSVGRDNQVFRTGFDSVDLDDLDYDGAGALWYKGCRCGDERGFLIKEKDLEEASDESELHVGCRGCSLWLRVLFGVAEESVDNHVTEVGATG